ncbi:MAG: hypothetical protein R3C49_10815 [Planctomycetaceae bacterium]
MSLPVELSGRAKGDMVRNAVWWADHHSVLAAIEWEEVVTRQLKQIGFAPESYPFFQTTVDYPVQMREALVGKGRRKYRAVFRTEDARILIVRIFSGEQGESTTELELEI